MLKLIGSTTSPYVRRIRVLLDRLQLAFELEPVVVFSEEGQKQIGQYNPTRRVPILIDDENIISDSTLIAEYLLLKYKNQNISPSDKQQLLLINEMTDAGVILFQLKMFDLDPTWSNTFAKNQLKRVESILAYFESNQDEEMSPLLELFLFCTLDWFSFRQIIEWPHHFPHLRKKFDSLAKLDEFQKTLPRI